MAPSPSGSPSSEDSSSSSSPPPSKDSSPPPPSSDSSQSSSPPPPSSSDDSSSSSPPPSSNESPPPPSKDSNDNSSPPSPPQSSDKKSPPSGFSSPPPPPPRSQNNRPSLAPPPPYSSNDSSSSPSSNVSVIAGVLVGGGLLLLIMAVIVIACTKRKRRRNDYYENYPKGDENYSGQHGNWYHSGPHNMTAHSSGMAPPGGWMPPPPPHMVNGEMSGNYSSGPRQPALPPPHPSVALGFNKSTFTYDELAAATDGFSQANILGQGGFGFVHKGVLPDGKEIAVKSLKAGSGQGEREFQAEVEIISRVHHRHLASLVGYCIIGAQRMLVYEFVPNNTLEFHLHGKGRPVMDLPTRLKIALGSAKGLAYLHEDCHPRIIHRDIKAANILIDNYFEAKVADFGLAKLSSDNNTHVSTRVMGTFGYLAPEYAASGKLTEKSDIFSFGVMLLELITGRRPVDPTSEDDNLVEWARPLLSRALEDRIFTGLVDTRLENDFNIQEMSRLVACAAVSIRHSAKRRPKMSQIVHALEGDVSLDDLNEVKLGQNALFGSGSGSSDYDSGDMEKLRRRAWNDPEFSGGEYRATNEFSQVSSTHV